MSEVIKKALTDKTARNSASLLEAAVDGQTPWN